MQTILIDDLELRKKLDTGTSRIYLGWNEKEYRPEILKFCRNEKLQKHEARILRVLEKDKSIPDLRTTGNYKFSKEIPFRNRTIKENYTKPYVIMSMGRGEIFEEAKDNTEPEEKLLLDRISSLDLLLQHTERKNTEEPFPKNIPSHEPSHLRETYSSMDWNQKMGFFLEIMEIVKRNHAKNIVHGDIKPGNIVMVDPLRGNTFLQVIDYETAIDLDNIKNVPERVFRPTTIPYNSRKHLEQAKKYLSRGKSFEELLSETTTEDFKKRDIHGLARLGQDMILERSPFLTFYSNAVRGNSKIDKLKAEMSTNSDDTIHREYDLEKIECSLEAQEKYRKTWEKDKTNNDVPRGVKEVLARAGGPHNPYDSLDQLIKELEYERKNWVGKGADVMSRKDFLATASTVVAIIGGSMVGAKPFYDKVNSPEILCQGLIRQDGDWNPRDVEFFRERIMEEQINPGLDRAIKLAKKKEIFNVGLREVQNNKYSLSAENSFIMGYTPRFQLQRAKISKREEDYHDYEFLIRNMDVTEETTNNDWRKFGKIDPLVEFLSEYEKTEHGFSDETIERAARNLAIESEKLTAHFVRAGKYGYFQPRAGMKPEDQEYEHIIHGDSYYLAKHAMNISNLLKRNTGEIMKEERPMLKTFDFASMYEQHVTATEALLTRTDQRAYSKLYFNLEEGSIISWRSDSAHNEWGVTDKHEFFASSEYQAYVIDLLSDAEKHGVLNMENHKELYRKYKEAMKKTIQVINSVYAPEYIPPDEYLAHSKKMDQLPKAALAPNNLPYSYILNTITNDKKMEEDIQKKKVNLLKMMDFSGEGILGTSRRTYNTTYNKFIDSDFYAFVSLKK